MTYNLEEWNTFYIDFLPLWDGGHLEESRAMEYAEKHVFDASRYCLLDQAGILVITTARDDAKLCGYFVTLCDVHLNLADLKTASPPLYYLHPDYRGKGIGGELIRFTENVLRKRGVELFSVGVKTYLPYAPVFDHLGYREVESVYIKRLDF
mgnify:FL=1